jgi:hypothetical protein
MEPLRSQDFKDIFSIMRATDSSLDRDIFHPKVLDSFSKISRMENSIFPLADDVSAKDSALV